MSQLFLGKSQVMLFKQISDLSPIEPIKNTKTKVWLSNVESEYDEYLIEGEFTEEKCIAAGFSPSEVVKIEFGTSVTSIEEAFYNCSNLTNVIISDSVTSIADYAFWQCSNLTNVTAQIRIMYPNNDVTQWGITEDKIVPGKVE